jgi:pimeloyl-ACP methyl ester carboxylesterase
MGGYVALRLCQLHPDRVSKVFTMATKFDWNPATAAKEAKMLDPYTIYTKVPKYAEMLAERHHGNDWKINLTRTATLMRSLGKSPLLGPEQFAAIQHPVRLGLGDRDTMVSLEETIAAYRALPNAELLVMPGTPHPIEKVDVERICAELVAYFGTK